MKPHRILKSFRGSQDGINTEHFQAGTDRPLSPDLARIVVKEGWASPIEASKAEDRETKVTGPRELKGDLETMSYKDLQALAKERGVPMQAGMKKEALVQALQEA